MANLESLILKKLEKFDPLVLKLEDQSKMHGNGLKSGTHFKLLLVSNYFKNKSRVERQREVSNMLKEEFKNGLHALSQKILDEEEYQSSTLDHKTVPCVKHKQKV